MTLLTLPGGEPFFAASYLPKEVFLKLLPQAALLWREDRAGVASTAQAFVQQMRQAAERPIVPCRPTSDLTQEAVQAYAARFDRRWGGFGPAPKFPCAHDILFLLAHFQNTGDKKALAMAEGTLTAMYRGGIFDHIGGGFCRYSVDRQWLVPHFEKMLYDNALLLWAYAQAWQLAGNTLYQEAARRTAAYVLRELTGSEGEFYSAQDADSQGREGAYYLFDREELLNYLGPKDGTRFCDGYSILPGGNFEGRSIPNLISNPRFAQTWEELGSLGERVYAYRRERMPLKWDDKVLTGWNSLMITALCQASKALGEPAFLAAARRAEAFIAAHLTREDGGLWLRYRQGEAKGEGVLTDYAFYALALTALYQATREASYLSRGEETAERMLKAFGDTQNGGLYLYAAEGEQLITRPKEVWDGAVPSGNSAAALALWQLAASTHKPRWQKAARRQLAFAAGAASQAPSGHGFALLAVSQALRYEHQSSTH